MVDVIFTLTRKAGLCCCVAVEIGLLYGIRSSDNHNICSQYYTNERKTKIRKHHKVVFIDNEFMDYNHNHHLSVVKEHKPKYATVLDIFSPKQCRELGITYTPFKQIIEWAYELNEYAENVIVIPKVDVIDYIPKDFMLGYSVPTSYGGTEIPIERFKGHKVHLLGGSTKKQVEIIKQLGKNVVSVDTNYFHKVSKYGSIFNLKLANDLNGCNFFTHKDSIQLKETNLGHFDRPFWPTFVINTNNYLQSIKSAWNECDN